MRPTSPRRGWALLRAHRLDVAGALASCFLLFVIFAPVLFQDRTLSSAAYTLGTNGLEPFPGQDPVGEPDRYRLDVSASALQFEPWAEVISESWWDGELPMWNPYQGAGTPMAANMSSAAFDPLVLPVNLHPTPWVWDLNMLATMALGAIATYTFCRVVSMGYIAAVVGASIFSASGYVMLYSNTGYIHAYAYLPILCIVIEWLIRSSRVLPIALLGVATAACIAVGMPETAFFVLMAAGCYGLWRSFRGPRYGTWRRALGGIAVGLAFGLVLSAPLLAIFLEYERFSFNDHKGDYGGGRITDPARHLLTWIAPFFNGAPNDATSAPGTLTGVRNWVGGGAIALAAIGLASRTPAARLVVPVFAAFGGLLLAKAYGFPPLDWIGRLPVFELVILPGFALPVAGFAIAVVSAAGVDGIRRRQLSVWVAATCIAVAIVATVVLLVANRSTFEAIGLRQLARQLGLATVAFIVVVVAARLLRPRWAAYSVAIVVGAELVILAPGHLAHRADPFETTEWLRTLDQRLSTDPVSRVMGLDAVLFPNTAAAHEVYDVRMLDALFVDRYQRYLRSFVDPGVFGRFTGGPWGSVETGPEVVDNPMFDLLGVRWVLARHDLVAATPDADQYVPAGRAGTTYIFENTRAAPRAFVVHDVVPVADVDEAESVLTRGAGRFANNAARVTAVDVRSTAVVEVAEEPLALRAEDACEQAGVDMAAISHYAPSEVRIDVDSPCGGLLVLTDTYFPGWQASVDGESATIHPTNVALRGVVVPPGSSEVIFRYQPASFRTGLVIAVSGGLAMIGFGIWSHVRRRRVKWSGIGTTASSPLHEAVHQESRCTHLAGNASEREPNVSSTHAEPAGSPSPDV